MVRHDPVRDAAAPYTKPFLAVYDAWVIRLSNRFAWRCDATVMLDRYHQHVGRRHLEVGPGRGWYLAHTTAPLDRVTLMDLNPSPLPSGISRPFSPTTAHCSGRPFSGAMCRRRHCSAEPSAPDIRRLAPSTTLTMTVSGSSVLSRRRSTTSTSPTSERSRCSPLGRLGVESRPPPSVTLGDQGDPPAQRYSAQDGRCAAMLSARRPERSGRR